MRGFRLAMVAGMCLACGGGSDTPTTPGNTGGTCTVNCGGTPSAPVTTNAIDVVDNSFNPAGTTVTPGTTVTWTWKGFEVHNVTFSQTSLGTSGNQTSGTYQKAFPTAGTFSYSCTNHIGMSGSITVK